jgi:hypothetical protein
VDRLPAPHQQPYATTAGHPAHHTPALQPTAGTVELYGERPVVVYVPSAEDPNVMVGVDKRHVQPMLPGPARDLTPAPLLDARAQQLFGAGVGAGVLLWGGGQFLEGLGKMLAAATGTGVFALCLLAVVGRAVFTAGRRGIGGSTYIHNEIHTEQKWLGKTDIDIHNN